MGNLVIYGVCELARQLKWYIDHDDDRTVIAFCVDDAYYDCDTFCDLPVIPYSRLKAFYEQQPFEILLGVGYTQMNDVRKRIFQQCKADGYTIASYIHSSAIIESDDIGEGNIILEQTLIMPFCKIGKGNLMWDKICIGHNSVVGDFNHISGSAGFCGFVTVGDNCFIGKMCCLRDGIHVSDYTLVGAMAYVASDTPENSVIVAPKGVLLDGKNSKQFI